MNVIINGCTGRMGQAVAALAEQTADTAVVAGVSPALTKTDDTHFLRLADVNVPADCVVDFSHHAATKELLEYCLKKNLPVVVATTGQTPEENALIAEAAKRIPVFRAANMSLGVAFLAQVVKKAAALFPDADIEITEIHHNGKLDVPSGTALALADSVKEARPEAETVVGRHSNGLREKREVGVHSLRLGSQVGTHTVYVDTGSETLSFTHQANSRALFAEGALSAARFIVCKGPGLYGMADMLAVSC
ncbi:MAG: 4-hydroxy-tetrahydrodipicolinate reductase [Clostridia bacterium]|nr:4-hydroxy-tetrahydrodipicolinate reductase [Clostridia bacterium]